MHASIYYIKKSNIAIKMIRFKNRQDDENKRCY